MGHRSGIPTRVNVEKPHNYDEDLARRQREHLARVRGGHSDWQPCLHDQCQSCHGTGINSMGGACIHAIACPCPKHTARSAI